MESDNIIVMAEDDLRLRKLYTSALTAAGFEVSTVGDGIEALKVLRTAEPNLVLLDIMMPRLNGIDTCKQARGLVGPDVPIVFLSTLDRLDVLRDCVVAGADGYIIKSDSLQSLIDRVKKWSRMGGKGQLAARRKQMLAEIARELAESEGDSESQTDHDSSANADVRAIAAFVGEARTLVNEDFGKAMEEKLYLLGYVTGAVEYWVETKDPHDEEFMDFLRRVLLETRILNNREAKDMVESIQVLAKDKNFSNGRNHGRKDPIRWRCDGEAYVPPGLALFRSPIKKSTSAA